MWETVCAHLDFKSIRRIILIQLRWKALRIDLFGLSIQVLLFSSFSPGMVINTMDTTSWFWSITHFHKVTLRIVWSVPNDSSTICTHGDRRQSSWFLIAVEATIVAYACAVERTATTASFDGKHSLYTCHSLRYLATPNVDIEQILRSVAIYVQRDPKNIIHQNPYRYSSCNELIYLAYTPGMCFSPWGKSMHPNAFYCKSLF